MNNIPSIWAKSSRAWLGSTVEPSHARPTVRKRRSRPISRVLSWTVIPLGVTSPQRSSNLPGSNAGRAKGSLFGLAPGGVCRAGLLPDSRCALTAPFHPYRPSEEDVGGIFLLHFPSACAAQALPGTLPYGARTFLPSARLPPKEDDDEAATVWSASARSIEGLPPVVIPQWSSQPAGWQQYYATRGKYYQTPREMPLPASKRKLTR